MLKELKPAILMTIVLTVVTGVLYPLAITAILQVTFPYRASGSLISRNGKLIGSELIAQSFTRPEYFHARPSATSPKPWDPTASGGSNLGPTNPALLQRLSKAASDYRNENPSFTGPIPSDAITTSASGLDPDITPANAIAQAARVAAARGVSTGSVEAFVRRHTRGRDLGFLGEPRANVLELNLAMDAEMPKR